MPAKHRLWPHQQRRPGVRRQPIAQRRQDRTVARRPPYSVDLALQYLDLAATDQHFGLKLGFIPPALRSCQ